MGDPIFEKFDIYDRCVAFSKMTIKVTADLKINYQHRPLMAQLIRSATSIGANMMEASEAQSAKDFISKISISLKEAKETVYWLELLQDAGYEGLGSMFTEAGELVKILAVIRRRTSTKV